MFCMFAGIRGWGEWIAPMEGWDADCGVPVGGGYEKGECGIGGACCRCCCCWAMPFRMRESDGDEVPIGGLSKNCGFDCVDLQHAMSGTNDITQMRD